MRREQPLPGYRRERHQPGTAGKRRRRVVRRPTRSPSGRPNGQHLPPTLAGLRQNLQEAVRLCAEVTATVRAGKRRHVQQNTTAAWQEVGPAGSGEVTHGWFTFCLLSLRSGRVVPHPQEFKGTTRDWVNASLIVANGLNDMGEAGANPEIGGSFTLDDAVSGT